MCPILIESIRAKRLILDAHGVPCRGEVPVLHTMNMCYYYAHSVGCSNDLGTYL